MATLRPDEQSLAESAALAAFRTTAGVPNVQMFNATPPGTMVPRPAAPVNTSPAFPQATNLQDAQLPTMSYGEQMSNVGRSFLDMIGAGARFLFNVPGGGGVLDPNRLATQYPAAPAATVPVGPAGGPDRVGGPQAQVEPARVVQKAQGPTAQKGTGAAMPPPPQAQPALIPGQTGFYVNNDLVPYGTTINSGPVGYRPPLRFSEMLEAMRDASLRQLGAVSQATGGDKAAMRAAAGTFNPQAAAAAFASMYGDAMRSNASMYGAEVGAGATLGASQNNLTGDLARSRATVDAASLGAAATNAQTTALNERFFATPQPIGTALEMDPTTRMMVPTTVYGMPQRGGGMPPKVDTKTKPKEGATGTYQGRPVVVRNGEVVFADEKQK